MATAMAATGARAEATFDTVEAADIVVTANKRAERLQDVPIAVSALSGEGLAASHVTQSEDIAQTVPNLQMNTTVGDNTPIFSLRGVSMYDYSLNQSSPVATYYDEVYKGSFALLGATMFDIDRIEILRGPQGTLYGKNTTGGAINIVTNTAKLGETGGTASFGYGNYNRVDARGAVNLPLGDKAALRVAGTFSRADGWLDNQTPGKPDLNSVREFAVRGSLLVEPADGTSFVLRVTHSYQNPRNYGIYAEPLATNRAGLSTYQIRSNLSDIRRMARTTAVSLSGNVEISDALKLTSITSYDKGKLFLFEDTDGQDVRVFEVSYDADARQWTQDVRLTSDYAGPFNFILGGYFSHEKVFNSNATYIFADTDYDGVPGITGGDCAAGFPLGCVFTNRFDQKKESAALYGDASLKATGALTFRAGLRYTRDTGSQANLTSVATALNGDVVSTPIPRTDLEYETNNVSGKFGLDYRLSADVLAYATFSRGYRSPSFNAQAFFAPAEAGSAASETINAYELGLKSELADRSAVLNLAAFYYDYHNQQFISVDPATAAANLINIPKSRIYGAEAELSWEANDTLTLHSGIGLLNSKVQRGVISGIDIAGKELPSAPSFSMTGGVDLNLLDSAQGKLVLSGSGSYASGQYFEIMNVSRLKQGGYAIFNAHLDWESADGRWNASLWGRNLGRKFYTTAGIDLSGFGFDYKQWGTPRTYGVTVGTRF
ncbi:MAG: TonB-dependent receptor [Chakrabartia godavariana]